MSSQKAVEEFKKLSRNRFFRDDWVGTFDFDMICLHCPDCDPSCAPYWDRHAHPYDFPGLMPLGRVINLKCKACGKTKMRFRVTV